MARILEDGRYPSDLSDKIRAVLTIVPHRTEEEICIALHDADFDPENAITTLLDTDSHSAGVSIVYYLIWCYHVTLHYHIWCCHYSGLLAEDARERRS